MDEVAEQARVGIGEVERLLQDHVRIVAYVGV